MICNFTPPLCCHSNTVFVWSLFTAHEYMYSKKPIRNLVTHIHGQEISFLLKKSCYYCMSQIPLILYPRHWVLVLIMFKKSGYCRTLSVNAWVFPLLWKKTTEHFSLELSSIKEIVPVHSVFCGNFYVFTSATEHARVFLLPCFCSHNGPYNLLCLWKGEVKLEVKGTHLSRINVLVTLENP